jgi:hypothetical protein
MATCLLANAGIPFVCGRLMTSLWLIVPIVLVEAGFLAAVLKQPYRKVVIVAGIANIVSTIACIVMKMVLFSMLTHVFSLPMLLIGFIGGFVGTIIVEFFVVQQAFSTYSASALWRVIVTSNAVTYIFLFIVIWGGFLSTNIWYVSGRMRNLMVADMRAIGTALGSYQFDTGHFPLLTQGTFREIAFQSRSADGLTRAYYEGASTDAWGRDFYYHGTHAGDTLKSFGRDQQPGGNKELDSDIVYINGTFRAPVAIRGE